MIKIHKQTIYHPSRGYIPNHWAVQYWENNPSYPYETRSFFDPITAKNFEKTLISYDNWASSQEEPLETQ